VFLYQALKEVCKTKRFTNVSFNSSQQEMAEFDAGFSAALLSFLSTWY